MAKSLSLPSHAVRLTTFAELESYVLAFGAGHLNLLMIFGPPGVGKSRLVRQALGSQVCWIGGQATHLVFTYKLTSTGTNPSSWTMSTVSMPTVWGFACSRPWARRNERKPYPGKRQLRPWVNAASLDSSPRPAESS